MSFSPNAHTLQRKILTYSWYLRLLSILTFPGELTKEVWLQIKQHNFSRPLGDPPTTLSVTEFKRKCLSSLLGEKHEGTEGQESWPCDWPRCSWGRAHDPCGSLAQRSQAEPQGSSKVECWKLPGPHHLFIQTIRWSLIMNLRQQNFSTAL